MDPAGNDGPAQLMRVKSGAEWKVPETGKQRLLEITLDNDDGEHQFGEAWATMTLQQRKSQLQRLADTYIVVAMYKEGALSKDYTVARLKAIQGGANADDGAQTPAQ